MLFLLVAKCFLLMFSPLFFCVCVCVLAACSIFHRFYSTIIYCVLCIFCGPLRSNFMCMMSQSYTLCAVMSLSLWHSLLAHIIFFFLSQFHILTKYNPHNLTKTFTNEKQYWMLLIRVDHNEISIEYSKWPYLNCNRQLAFQYSPLKSQSDKFTKLFPPKILLENSIKTPLGCTLQLTSKLSHEDADRQTVLSLRELLRFWEKKSTTKKRQMHFCLVAFCYFPSLHVLHGSEMAVWI